jgi:hypothetical protein
MSAVRPSTPTRQTPADHPQPGTWRHPKLDEIVKRQNASAFTRNSLVRIGYNVGGILFTHFLGRSLWNTWVLIIFTGKHDADTSQLSQFLLSWQSPSSICNMGILPIEHRVCVQCHHGMCSPIRQKRRPIRYTIDASSKKASRSTSKLGSSSGWLPVRYSSKIRSIAHSIEQFSSK